MEDFIAGWIGGMFGVAIGHPLDTVKVRQQTYSSSLYTAIRRTFKHEGVRGFFKGLSFPLITYGPANALLFGVYGHTLHLLESSGKRSYTISYDNYSAIAKILVAGTVGGFFQIMFLCPIELVKTVLQARTGGKGSWRKHYEVPYKRPLDAFKGIYHERGIRGLYKGLTPFLIRDVPTSGLFLLTYEMLMYYNFSQCGTPILVKQIIAGGTAGVMSWIFVFPFDVVKSRLQTDNPYMPKYKGMVDCFKKSYRAEGFRIFYKGAPAVLLRTFPVNAAIFTGYEYTLSVLP